MNVVQRIKCVYNSDGNERNRHKPRRRNFCLRFMSAPDFEKADPIVRELALEAACLSFASGRECCSFAAGVAVGVALLVVAVVVAFCFCVLPNASFVVRFCWYVVCGVLPEEAGHGAEGKSLQQCDERPGFLERTDSHRAGSAVWCLFARHAGAVCTERMRWQKKRDSLNIWLSRSVALEKRATTLRGKILKLEAACVLLVPSGLSCCLVG